jgi:FkbM family methyltransferase
MKHQTGQVSLTKNEIETMKISIIKQDNQFIINGCPVYYLNKEADYQTIEEVFGGKGYDFDTQVDAPVIIDAGANIGISTLFFKLRYPNANILCFEPDPNAFKMLQKNICENEWKNVIPINAALSNKAEKINFFGDFDTNSPNTRENSIFPVWGLREKSHKKIQVTSTKLSSYILDTVDFLKLNIEGAEKQVLEEIADKLHLVKQIGLEVHQSKDIINVDNTTAILDLLIKHKFKLNISQRKNNNFLTVSMKEWKEKINPTLLVVEASKSLKKEESSA